MVLLLCAALAACAMDDDERTTLLESAGRTNYAIGRGTVVRDLRSPSDTGRLIYQPPTNLSRRTAPPAGARQVWAPFGIATPDTTAQRATTYR
jgi:hypothetical protein